MQASVCQHKQGAAVPLQGRVSWRLKLPLSFGRGPHGRAAAVLERRHDLPCGLGLELLHARAVKETRQRPPLLFLHGALHGAWCWQDTFLPWFAERGYEAYALSLRGHGHSDHCEQQPGSLDSQMEDLAHVVASLPRPPVVIAHSLSGVILQRYVAEALTVGGHPALAGAGFLAVPGLQTATGLSWTWLTQLHGIGHGLKIIWWMMAAPKGNASLVRELLFSPDLPDEVFRLHQARLAAARRLFPVSSRDLLQFKDRMAEMEAEIHSGQAAAGKLPVFVLAAGKDAMIMPCQVEATARTFDVQHVVAPGVAHDVMLDTRWQTAAKVLQEWLDQL